MFETYNKKYNLLEKNIDPLEDHSVPAKIIVHDGICHADDVMAVWLLQQINPEIEIIRTRQRTIIESGLKDPYTVVADVGFGFYDHHQKDSAVYDNSDIANKYAACGLVWKIWGETIVNKWIAASFLPIKYESSIKTVYQLFLNYVIRPIEIKDTTYGYENVPEKYLTKDIYGSYPVNKEEQSIVSDFVRSFNSQWSPFVSQMKATDKSFMDALIQLNYFVLDYIASHKTERSDIPAIVSSLSRHNIDMLQQTRTKKEHNAFEFQLLSNYIRQEIKFIDPKVEVFSLDCAGIDLSVFNDTNIKLVLFPDIDQREIQIRSIKDSIKISPDLAKQYDENSFVSESGFFCVIHTNETKTIADISKDAAEICLKTMDAYYRNEFDFGLDFINITNMEAAMFKNL